MSRECRAVPCLREVGQPDEAVQQALPDHGKTVVKRGLLSINPEPIRLVDAAVRDVWLGTGQRPHRCHHEDGRGRCTSLDTAGVWRPDERYVEYLCERHR